MRHIYTNAAHSYQRLTNAETVLCLQNGKNVYAVCFSNAAQPRSQVFTSRPPHNTTAIRKLEKGAPGQTLFALCKPTREALRAQGYNVQSTNCYADETVIAELGSLQPVVEVVPVKEKKVRPRKVAVKERTHADIDHTMYAAAHGWVQHVVNNNHLSYGYMRTWFDMLWVAMPPELVPYALAIGRRIVRTDGGAPVVLRNHAADLDSATRDNIVVKGFKTVRTAPNLSVYYMHAGRDVPGWKELHFGIYTHLAKTKPIMGIPDEVVKKYGMTVTKTVGAMPGEVESRFVRFALEEFVSANMNDARAVLDYYARCGAPLYFRNLCGSGPFVQPVTVFEPVRGVVPYNLTMRQSKRGTILNVEPGQGTVVPFCFSPTTGNLYLQLLIMREVLRNMVPECSSPYEAVIFANTDIHNANSVLVEDFCDHMPRDLSAGFVQIEIKRQLIGICQTILKYKVTDPKAIRGQYERLHTSMQAFIESWALAGGA